MVLTVQFLTNGGVGAARNPMRPGFSERTFDSATTPNTVNSTPRCWQHTLIFLPRELRRILATTSSSRSLMENPHVPCSYSIRWRHSSRCGRAGTPSILRCAKSTVFSFSQLTTSNTTFHSGGLGPRVACYWTSTSKWMISVKSYALKFPARSSRVISARPQVPGADPAGRITVQV